MFSTSQTSATGFFFCVVLTTVLETMRHDSSASRRKGKTPKRRPPRSPQEAAGTSPRTPRKSGVSSECDSCCMTPMILIKRSDNYNYTKCCREKSIVSFNHYYLKIKHKNIQFRLNMLRKR